MTTMTESEKLAYLKRDIIQLVKGHYTATVFPSMWDQLCAGVDGGDVNMANNITSYKSEITDVETDINGLVNRDIITNYNNDDSDVDKRTHVATYCTTLTQDRQKDAVAMALSALSL